MRVRKSLALTVAGLSLVTGLAACGGNGDSGTAGGTSTVLNIGMPNGPQAENNNPLIETSALSSLGYRWQIYEPLMMANPVQPDADPKPWLATGATWSADHKSVTITVRKGVTWSDGQKFGAADVAYTFGLLKDNEALNSNAIPFDTITADGDTVHVSFTSSQFVNQTKILAQTPIVPEHIWSKLADPATDVIKDPVGTGPYTLKSFTPQTVTLDLRADNAYWGTKPKVKELRYTSYTDNNAQTTALANGESEWSFVFIPGYKNVFVNRDAKHNKVWAPAVLAVHGLYLNTSKKPFDDPILRQAMNLVINREDIYNQAEGGYFHPPVTNVTGIPDSGASFIAPQYKDQKVSVDVDGAKQLLTSHGYTLDGNTLKDPTGKPVTLTLTDPSGFSDYQTSLEIIKDNLSQIGIAATVDKANQDAWSKNLETGNFDAAIRWTNSGATPYDIYQTVMDGTLYQPVGKSSPKGNFGRFKNEEATQALRTYATASSDAARTQALTTLQDIFVKEVPMIPLGANNLGATYSTRHWTGWPDDSNPYCASQPVKPCAADVVQHLIPSS